MKKLTTILFTILGIIMMANAASFSAPSSDFVLIKGGSFTMGSPETEDWRSNDESQHRVTLAPFLHGKV